MYNCDWWCDTADHTETAEFALNALQLLGWYTICQVSANRTVYSICIPGETNKIYLLLTMCIYQLPQFHRKWEVINISVNRGLHEIIRIRRGNKATDFDSKECLSHIRQSVHLVLVNMNENGKSMHGKSVCRRRNRSIYKPPTTYLRR